MSTTTPLGFVEPVVGDPMCFDPAFPFPKQTSVESLADSIDGWQGANFDADVARLALGPRVKVSRSNYDSTVAGTPGLLVFDTVEYNVGTSTDLSVVSNGIILPPGMWVITAEVLLPSTTDMLYGTLAGAGAAISLNIFNAASIPQGEPPYGGGGQVTVMNRIAVTSTFTIGLSITSTSGGAKYLYLAYSAVKIADYF